MNCPSKGNCSIGPYVVALRLLPLSSARHLRTGVVAVPSAAGPRPPEGRICLQMIHIHTEASEIGSIAGIAFIGLNDMPYHEGLQSLRDLMYTGRNNGGNDNGGNDSSSAVGGYKLLHLVGYVLTFSGQLAMATISLTSGNSHGIAIYLART